jgi:hypothetical protein
LIDVDERTSRIGHSSKPMSQTVIFAHCDTVQEAGIMKSCFLRGVDLCRTHPVRLEMLNA